MAPTIVLVPGAAHTAATFDPLTKALQALGYPVTTTTLSSVGSTHTSRADDTAAFASQTLDPLLDKGTDILLVAHSYAGFVAAPLLAAAAKSNRRARGQDGGIIGILYMAAFIPPEGASLREVVGGTHPPWQLIDEENDRVTIDDPAEVFYGDVEESLKARTIALLETHSLSSFRSPAGAAGYADRVYNGRRAYMACEFDKAIPHFVQKMWIENSGVEWEVKEMKTAHAPFLSATDDVAIYISSLALKWDT